MPSTSFTLAGAGTDLGSSWTNPGNITADDAVVATGVAIFSGSTSTLKASSFGLAVPAGATIDGVETRVQISHGGGVESGTLSSINIGTSDSVLGTAKSPSHTIISTPTDFDDGSSTDLWDLTLTPTLVNAADFQVRMVVTAGGLGINAEVDAIWVNVHFTLGGARNRGWVIG